MTFAADRAAVQAEIDATTTQATDFLTQLVDISNVDFSYGFNIDNLLPDSYNYATVPQVAFPVVGTGIRPNVSALDASMALPDAPTVSFTALTNITLPTDDLVTPTNSFAYAEGTYDRALLDPWRTKMLADLTNGGYGIDTTDEIAPLNRGCERAVEVAGTRIGEAGRAMAVRGFPLPPGELSIYVDRAWQDMQDKVSTANREIYIDRAKRFVDARQFTITEIRQMESLTMALYNAIQERALNVSKATLELAIALFNAQVSRYRARLEAAIASGQVQYQRAQSEEAQARAYYEIYRSKIQGFEASLRRAVDVARVQVEAYAVDVQLDRVLNDGLAAQAQLQVKTLEATVTQNTDISRLAIENARAKLEATVHALKFRTESVHYGSEKFFAQLTTLLGTLNSLSVQTGPY